MDLNEYLFRKDLSKAKFAKLIDYDPDYVRHVARKLIKPGRKFIKRVVEATNGEVTEQDLLKGKDEVEN